MTFGELTSDADQPGVGLGAFGPAGVAETHAGVVLFLGDRAEKVKKPVGLGFLDFRTREAAMMCAVAR